MKSQLTQALVKSLFHYDPETGVLTRIGGDRRTTAAQIGKRAGSVGNEGYRWVRINRKAYAEHRVIWLYMTGELPPLLDHRNGDRADNRFANLRPGDKALNSQNIRKAYRTSTTGLLGAFTSPGGKFRSHISVNKRVHFLGIFDTPEEAHQAYMAAKAKYHAEAIGGQA